MTSYSNFEMSYSDVMLLKSYHAAVDSQCYVIVLKVIVVFTPYTPT